MNGTESFFLMCLTGAICAWIASSKGRNAFGWFFCGFFFSLIGLILIVALSNLKTERAILNAQLEMNRRLRDQGQRTRQKVEQITHHTLSRLDQHDLALGLDTRNLAPALDARTTRVIPPALPATKPAPAPASILPSRSPAMEEAPAIWFWNDGSDARLGPVTIHALKLGARSGRLLPESLVWKEGMETWEEAGSVQELDGLWNAQIA